MVEALGGFSLADCLDSKEDGSLSKGLVPLVGPRSARKCPRDDLEGAFTYRGQDTFGRLPRYKPDTDTSFSGSVLHLEWMASRRGRLTFLRQSGGHLDRDLGLRAFGNPRMARGLYNSPFISRKHRLELDAEGLIVHSLALLHASRRHDFSSSQGLLTYTA